MKGEDIHNTSIFKLMTSVQYFGLIVKRQRLRTNRECGVLYCALTTSTGRIISLVGGSLVKVPSSILLAI